MDALAVAVLLATANKALLDFCAAPIRRRWPEVDLWWFDYVALATGAVIGWFAGVNCFAGLVGDATLGRALTALLVGGGAAMLNAVLATGRPAPAGRAGPGTGRPRRVRGW